MLISEHLLKKKVAATGLDTDIHELLKMHLQYSCALSAHITECFAPVNVLVMHGFFLPMSFLEDVHV